MTTKFQEAEENVNISVHEENKQVEYIPINTTDRRDFEKSNVVFVSKPDETRQGEEKILMKPTPPTNEKEKGNQKSVTFELVSINENKAGTEKEPILKKKTGSSDGKKSNTSDGFKENPDENNSIKGKKMKAVIKKAQSLAGIIKRQKLLSIVDKLRSQAGLKNIKKCSLNSLKILNDMSFERKKLWKSEFQFDSQSPQQSQGSKSKKLKRFCTPYSKCMLYICKGTFFKVGMYFWNLFEEKVPVFKPMGRINFIWALLMLLLIFWHLNTLTLMVAFDIQPVQSYSFSFEALQKKEIFSLFQVLSAILFSIDMFLKFNTACYEGGNLIFDKSKIVKKYLKEEFLFDFLGLLPHFICLMTQDTPNENEYPKYFWLLLFKLKPLLKFFENINEGLITFEGQKEATYRLSKLLAEVFIICHLFACVWHYTALKNQEGKNWVEFLRITDQGWEERYMKAIYYIIVTMTTTGYGDITPQNKQETIVAICCMFIGSALVGYTINTIGGILESLHMESNLMRKKLQMLNSFMRRNSVSLGLQTKVRKYLQYIWGKSLEEDKLCQELLKELPSNYREEVLINIQGDILMKAKILSKYFSPETLKKLAPIMAPVHLSPGEYVFSEGDLDDESMYIVSSGSVELVADYGKKGFPCPMIIKALEKNSSLGEISFFTGAAREISARAKDFCTLIKIDKTEFLNIIRSEEMEWETFYQIRDWILLDTEFKNLGLKCYSCNKIDHQLSKCPWVSHQPTRDIIINRHLNKIANKPKKKKSFTRRPARHMNALAGINNVKSAVHNFSALLKDNNDLKILLEMESSQEGAFDLQMDSSVNKKNFIELSESQLLHNQARMKNSDNLLKTSVKPKESQENVLNEDKIKYECASQGVKSDTNPSGEKKYPLPKPSGKESEAQEITASRLLRKDGRPTEKTQNTIEQLFYYDMDKLNLFSFYSTYNNADIVVSKLKYQNDKSKNKVLAKNKFFFRSQTMKTKPRESVSQDHPKKKFKKISLK